MWNKKEGRSDSIMKSRRPKLVIIVGPTASGKSELAVRLARNFNGEIISADSRQVYKGLDIGTGKVPGKWRYRKVPTGKRSLSAWDFLYKGIPHHCIDFVPPKKTFTVAEYKKCADAAIWDISSRQKIPIIVGGTGFWVDTVVYNLNIPEVPPNQNLRRKLERKSALELFKMLQKLDPRRAKTIKPQNPRRLIRAIEVANVLGRVPELKRHYSYETLMLGLAHSYEVRLRKMRKRVRQMIQQGIVKETKKLLRQGVRRKRMKEFGFEYRAVLDYLDKRLTRRELANRMTKDTLQYSRRQMAWFKKNKEIHWLHKSAISAESLVRKFI